MTRQQAAAGSARLEQQGIAHAIRCVIVPVTGADFRLELDPDQTLTGAQLGTIIAAADQAGLQLTIRVSELGLA